MKTKDKKVTRKKVRSTSEEFIASLSSEEKLSFEQEYRDLLISELLLAIMEQDNISVRQLAKVASVSPTVVQAMRSNTKKDFSMQAFFKILNGLGFKRLVVERNGRSYPLDISHLHNEISTYVPIETKGTKIVR